MPMAPPGKRRGHKQRQGARAEVVERRAWGPHSLKQTKARKQKTGL